MSGQVVAATVAASAALIVATVGAFLTITGAHKQRSLDLLVSALADMESGTQRRSAAIAALQAMRGPIERELSWQDRGLWTQYGHPVGQQLFRVLSYVLNHAEVTTHGTENAIAMIDWLVRDPILGFRDQDQRRRLSTYLQAYGASLDPNPAEDTAQYAFRGRLKGWRHALEGCTPA